MRLTCLVVVLCLGACSSKSAPDVDAAVPLLEGAPALRLPDDVTPLHQSLRLSVDPATPDFHGQTTLKVRLSRPRSTLWLHAVGLEFLQVKADGLVGTARLESPFVGLDFPRPLPAGEVTLELAWAGTRTDTAEGLLLAADGDHRFLFTQFESVSARHVFPCFDEPGFKIPFQLGLEIPPDAQAFSNTPELEAQALREKRWVTFEETAPLPTYLLAFGVGPLVAVDFGTAGKKQTPLRVVVPRGREADVRYLGSQLARTLGWLEGWFGMPYPSKKLDLLVVSGMQSFGAMEHPGLITIADGYAYARPEEQTLGFRSDALATLAHELAHQWFGDLVTLQWWDDVWLNESFASWLELKCVSALEPGWNAPLDALGETASVMVEDELLTARAVRQPISSEDDVANAFDSITYEKGRALISMFEASMGPARFQQGVRAYLAKHADGVASSAQFLDELSAGAGVDVREAFRSFLDQPGLPSLTARLSCLEGRQALTLSQQRQLPLGADAGPPLLWKLPVCLRTREGEHCVSLDAREQTFALGGCGPVIVNAHAQGYYRVRRTVAEVRELVRSTSPLARFREVIGRGDADGGRGVAASLPPELPELLRALSDLQAQLRAGAVELDEVMGLLPELAASKQPEVVEAAAELVLSIPPVMIDPSQRPRLAAFVRRQFGARARSLGLHPAPGESSGRSALRQTLVHLDVSLGEDPLLIAQAVRVTERVLSTPAAPVGAAEQLALAVSGQWVSAPTFDRAIAQVVVEQNPSRRAALLQLLAGAWEPQRVARALQITVDPGHDVRPMIWVMGGAARATSARRDFVFAHVEALQARHLPLTIGWLTQTLWSCDDDSRALLEAKWKPVVQRVSGGPREYAQALEQQQRCVAFRQRHQASLDAWLATLPAR